MIDDLDSFAGIKSTHLCLLLAALAACIALLKSQFKAFLSARFSVQFANCSHYSDISILQSRIQFLHKIASDSMFPEETTLI